MEQFLDIITNPTFLIGLAIAVGAYVFGLSIILAIWTARDARRRSKNFLLRYGTPLFVLLFGIVGFLAYVVLRPSKTMRERKNERLERELLMQASQEFVCPDCDGIVQEDFSVCPHCKTNFKSTCECGAVLEKEWKRCGYCGTAKSNDPRHKDFKEPVIKN